MPEVVEAVARYGFLILIWLFIFAVARTIRKDLFSLRRVGGAAAAAGPQPSQPQQSRQAAGAQWLVVTQGELAGRRFQLSGQMVTIGRANDSTVVIRDDFASTRHARIVPRGGQWVLEDLGSTNGTYLGRARVTGPTPVPLGAPIRIGRSSFELRP
ncbi:FHA domain-containing protein FhaB/FipA [Natronoglycomyces albus]|uniref:FHA domain-containing protein n=1 Tax=Natronoglycomyces albus TaxID=2811108 RepID=A0A895XQ45_9ACTN|nr:FHA domain-containing protein [Natronoglycomyces albus]QSB05663.1 FHA domain-containing protein [Natronoglycomyces albus]